MRTARDLLDRLDARGYARLPGLLSASDCELAETYWEAPHLFRKEIEMGRHAYGDGRYRYFASPLPALVQRLREVAYRELAAVANVWQERLRLTERFPTRLDAFLARCAANEQSLPTPLMLRYEAGGYNRLHQDRYGEVAFPLQLVVLLSRPAHAGDGSGDFEGGEFLLTESRARMQTKATAIALERGEGLVFANQICPVESARGFARATVRHGVSEVRSGVRLALGLLFHDAER